MHIRILPKQLHANFIFSICLREKFTKPKKKNHKFYQTKMTKRLRMPCSLYAPVQKCFISTYILFFLYFLFLQNTSFFRVRYELYFFSACLKSLSTYIYNFFSVQMYFTIIVAILLLSVYLFSKCFVQ